MKRSVRSRLALLLSAISVASLASVATATSAVAVSPDCSTTSENRQPVLLVHGYNSGPATWNAATLKGYESISGTCLAVFDYKNWSTHWVTDPHIGPALATEIQTLSSAFKAGGGTGKVIVVAHSMGGLATRCAIASSCNGGISGLASDIRELISFGTPNTGTYLRGNGLQGVGEKTLGSLLSTECYVSFNGANPICEFFRAIGTSAATRAFTPGSKELNALPTMPANIPVFAMAAHIEAQTSLFGHLTVNIGDAGDLIVKENSAQDEGVRYGKLGGTQTVDCGDINILRLSGSNCWHSTETNDGRFISAAMKQINLAKQPAPKPKPTTQAPPPVETTTQAPPPVQQTTQAPVQTGDFSPGSPFNDICYNAAPFAPSYTSTSIQMTMSCQHVPQTKWFLEQVVYGDPHLNVTPSTGNMRVVGTVIDTAHSDYGYNILQIQATQITILGGS